MSSFSTLSLFSIPGPSSKFCGKDTRRKTTPLLHFEHLEDLNGRVPTVLGLAGFKVLG